MCGLAGFAAVGDGRDEERTDALLRRLDRRGPDGGWSARHAGHWFVHARLAVMDLDPRVVYPMPNESGDVWLVFNGEIYDHLVLRRELEARGHRFATGCDAEVVVHGWEEWGTGLFARLNGMFALAIADERHGEVVLARDRFGIKPLVRTTGPSFAFASDALALVAAGLSDGEVDDDAVAEHLSLHLVGRPRTGVRDLEDVDPGSWVRRRADGAEERGTFAPVDPGGPAPTAPVELDELDAALRTAVGRQLVADVPVGVFLSSGIDSALVLAYAAQAGARPVTFTVGFAGFGDYDEGRRAGELARHFGAEHRYAELDAGFAETVGEVAAAFDRPFADSSAIATLRLARLARQEVTVALSGTGGDELFQGYYRHRAHRLLRLGRVLPAEVLHAAARRTGRGGARSSPLALFTSYAGRLAAATQHDDPAAQYLSLLTHGAVPEGLLRRSLPEHAPQRFAARTGLALRPGSTVARDLAGHDLRSYLPSDLLTKEDRSTMAVGLEGRVPLLDDAVLDVAQRMPDRQKHHLRAGKLPLRALAGRRAPAWVTRGRKRGFAVPLEPLLRGRWAAEADLWLRETPSAFVDGPAAADALRAGSLPAATAWSLVTLAAWEQELARARQGRPSSRMPATT